MLRVLLAGDVMRNLFGECVGAGPNLPAPAVEGSPIINPIDLFSQNGT